MTNSREPFATNFKVANDYEPLIPKIYSNFVEDTKWEYAQTYYVSFISMIMFLVLFALLAYE